MSPTTPAGPGDRARSAQSGPTPPPVSGHSIIPTCGHRNLPTSPRQGEEKRDARAKRAAPEALPPRGVEPRLVTDDDGPHVVALGQTRLGHRQDRGGPHRRRRARVAGRRAIRLARARAVGRRPRGPSPKSSASSAGGGPFLNHASRPTPQDFGSPNPGSRFRASRRDGVTFGEPPSPSGGVPPDAPGGPVDPRETPGRNGGRPGAVEVPRRSYLPPPAWMSLGSDILAPKPDGAIQSEPPLEADGA
jgi:hypothetical protein